MNRAEEILAKFYKRTCSICDCSDEEVAIALSMNSWCCLLQVIAYAYKTSEGKDLPDDIRRNSLKLMREVYDGIKQFTKDYYVCTKCGTVVYFPVEVMIPLDDKEKAMARQVRCGDCVEL